MQKYLTKCMLFYINLQKIEFLKCNINITFLKNISGIILTFKLNIVTLIFQKFPKPFGCSFLKNIFEFFE